MSHEIAIADSGHPRQGEVLAPGALALIASLHRRFDRERKRLLAERLERQMRFDAGELPDFPAETADIRGGDWTVAPIPHDLLDRRVEITGPTNAKMVINALNSGAKVFMADFEDATAPRWDILIDGQANLIDRWAGKLDFTDPTSGKTYALIDKPAVLMVRPRGLHLDEPALCIDGEPSAGAFVDFALYCFHNAKAAIAQGSGPYFYIPKLEGRHEAALWNSVIDHVEDAIGLARGTIKITMLIETLPAAFEMEEMLHATREHAVGLNCGRWDYIFSFIKRLGKDPARIVPDRSAMTMDKAFLAAYSLRLIDACHRRSALAMGGMSAFIPVKDDEAANAAAIDKVRADKQREARNGHDGTWVAHPALVAPALEVFEALERSNQLHVLPNDVPDRDAMLRLHEGERTEAGAREAIRVGVQYLAAWIDGRGAVPLNNLMEDAATAEICRTMLWQWRRFEAPLSDGRRFTPALFGELFDGEVAALDPDTPRLSEAANLFRHMIEADELDEFLTLPAMGLLRAELAAAREYESA